MPRSDAVEHRRQSTTSTQCETCGAVRGQTFVDWRGQLWRLPTPGEQAREARILEEAGFQAETAASIAALPSIVSIDVLDRLAGAERAVAILSQRVVELLVERGERSAAA